jgi:hypothetical protein
MTRQHIRGVVGAALVVALAAAVALAGLPVAAIPATGDLPTDADDADDTDDVLAPTPDRLALVDRLVDEYNDRLDEAPDALREQYADDPMRADGAVATLDAARSQLADERVELRVTTDEGDWVVVAQTDESARIIDYEFGPDALDEPADLRLSTDEATLERVWTAEDPQAAAIEAYESGEIRIEGDGVDGLEAAALEASLRLGIDVAN